MPQIVFTGPEAAAVELIVEEATRQGHQARVVDYDLGNAARAVQYADGGQGRARAVRSGPPRSIGGAADRPGRDLRIHREEVLRHDSPVQVTTRTARTDDLTIDGMPIPRGGNVVLLIGAANRGPARFDPT
ncbi:hypothetical protein [Actinomadura verrucosospora]|uniref:hypothetical protein n=1 Tax=Actinomadura verrucosospora TaxID=46165 RepID=UPI00156733AA|nr:hypothetical protein [Actinomadura verrucosospora]